DQAISRRARARARRGARGMRRDQRPRRPRARCPRWRAAVHRDGVDRRARSTARDANVRCVGRRAETGRCPRGGPLGARRRARRVAVDVWGLGALAYDLLTGRAPWAAGDGLDAWERAASGIAPPPLANVPPRLGRVIAKAMALAPAERYASAAELGAELDA